MLGNLLDSFSLRVLGESGETIRNGFSYLSRGAIPE